MSNKRGILVLYTGCSGVGKGTIMKQLLQRDDSLRLSVSNTTRDPRSGEIDGVHYNFVSREEFLAMADADGYIEHAEYCGNFTARRSSRLRICSLRATMSFLKLRFRADCK